MIASIINRLLFQRLLISGCTETSGAIGDGRRQGTCRDPEQVCMADGKCLGN